MRVLLINGPPRCGKDTIAKLLRSMLPSAEVYGFADHAKQLTCLHHNVAAPWTAFDYRKDEPLAEFGGLTFRQAVIHVSENVIKPLEGDDYFGRYLAGRIRDRERSIGPHVALVADAGFRPEAEAIVAEFGIEAVRRLIVSKPGCTFSNDSRSIWPHIDGVFDHFVCNSGTLDDLSQDCGDLVRDCERWFLAHPVLNLPPRAALL